MKNRIILLLVYTVFIAVISALITTAWFHAFVLNNKNNQQQALVSFSPQAVLNSPVDNGEDIIEIFSYGCHYCAANEKHVDELEKRLPAGKKLVRLHFYLNNEGGLSRFAPVFATLETMGIEKAWRNSAYDAVIKHKIDLGDPQKRDAWLALNNINVAEYHKVSRSAAVKQRLEYMAKVTQYYNVTATPAFIVAKRWVALQDSDFAVFSDKLLSLLETDKAPENEKE